MLKFGRRQAGDTIVEVMIALAVTGAVIGSSFAIASRSSRVGQQAQERTEALKLVESQIELLKASAQSNNLTMFARTTPFCLSTNASGVVYNDNTSVPTDFIADSLGGYGAGCAQGTSNRYKMSIMVTNTTTAGITKSLFGVTARWEKIGGGVDEVKLQYRMHKGQYVK